MPVEDPLIAQALASRRANMEKAGGPEHVPTIRSDQPAQIPEGAQDPLVAQALKARKEQYMEQNSPTFNLNYEGPPQERMEWGDVGKKAAVNFVPSVGRAAVGMVQPILDPIGTAKNVYALGKGAYSKAKGALGYEHNAEDEQQLNALMDFYANRYGSLAGFQHAVAEDPASVLLDLSTPFTLGGGSVANIAGKISNPIALAGAVGKTVGKVPVGTLGTVGELAGAGASNALGYLGKGAGVSEKALPTAFKSGLAGGNAAEDFTSQMRNKVPANQILETFDDAVSSVAQKRKAEYLQGMGGLRNAPTLPTAMPIQQAANDAINSIAHYPTAAPTRDMIRGMMSDFQNGRIGEHTFNPRNPSLLDYDKLKQAFNDIAKNPMTPQGAVVGDIAKTIRNEIGNVSPEYAKIMDRYGEVSDHLKDVRSAFGKTGQADISRLRKLMTGMKREDKVSLLEELSKQPGGETLVNQLAGRELSGGMHEGLSGPALGGIGGYGLSFLLNTHPALAIPGAAVGAYARSPRALGETAYFAGKGLKTLKDLPPPVGAGMAQLGHYEMLGDAASDEMNPYLRAPRKSGGRTNMSPKDKADRLIKMVDKIKKDQNNETSSLLNLDDDTVIKALAVANKHI